jgi:DNA-binding transcriptional ArsR family regulator
LAEIDKTAIYQLHARFCKTLSDTNRLLIIAELSKGEVSVSELVKRLGLRQANVSKHLGIMRERGLVTARREGATIYYTLSDPRIAEAISLLNMVQTEQIQKQHNLAQRST